MKDLLVIEQLPQIPAEWNYEESVAKVKQVIYKWKNLTLELATELYIAREALTSQRIGRGFQGHTWSRYCEEIGASRDVVDEWLRRWFGLKKGVGKPTPLLPPGKARLKCGDFTKLSTELKDSSIPLIFTDPPYGQEWLHNWQALAEMAHRVLCPGGYLVTYAGQTYLPKVMSDLEQHLTYFWASAILLPQGNRQEFQTKVVNNWKPALIFTKGSPNKELLPWWLDVVKSRLEKDLDVWQQSVDIARYFIKIFSPERATVLDPCAGTGTFLIAALLEGRNAYGYELDPEHYQIALSRLPEGA